MNRWSYSIDYDKAIAEDERAIARLSSPECVRVSRVLLPAALAAYPQSTWSDWDVYHLVTYAPDGLEGRAAAFGLSLADARAWAFFCDEGREEIWTVLGDEQAGDYAKGRAIDARLDRCAFDVLPEDKRKKALAKAKASLARHKRNKSKWD